MVRPLSTVDNTRDYARVTHSGQWSNYNILSTNIVAVRKIGTKHGDIIFNLKLTNIWKSYTKKQRGPSFVEYCTVYISNRQRSGCCNIVGETIFMYLLFL